MQLLHSQLNRRRWSVVVHLTALLLRALGTRLSLLENHRNALGQVNDHIKQQGHDGQLWVLTDNSPDAYW